MNHCIYRTCENCKTEFCVRCEWGQCPKCKNKMYDKIPPRKSQIKYNLIYRLRKKGFRVITGQRMIMVAYLSNPKEVRQVARLVSEFNFCVQFEIA